MVDDAVRLVACTRRGSSYTDHNSEQRAPLPSGQHGTRATSTAGAVDCETATMWTDDGLIVNEGRGGVRIGPVRRL